MILDIIAWGILGLLGLGVICAIVDSLAVRLLFGFLAALVAIAWAATRLLS